MRKVSGDPKEEARLAFIAGKRNSWSAGQRGCTINCVRIGGRLLIRVRQPSRQQWPLDGEGDTPERRERLTQIAAQAVLDRRSGRSATVPVPEPLPPLPTIRRTVQDVWERYISDRWPGIPDTLIISGGRRGIRAFYNAMPPERLRRVPGPDYLLSTLQAMRRVTAYPAFAPNRPLDDIEPADWTEYTDWRTAVALTPGGRVYSPRTVETDYTRFNTAIRHCMRKRRKWWGDAANPLEGADVLRVDPQVPEIGELACRLLIRTLEAQLPHAWRIYAAVVIAHASGRRIGAIGADRLRIHADGLRGTDLETVDGRTYVTWRAAAAKGKGYGRGDERIAATRALADLLAWLPVAHPNPLGPAFPLLWAPDDPGSPVTYTALNYSFKAAWKKTFGARPPRGLAFHGFCRTVVTTLGDELGIEKAAEYTGRSAVTAAERYKRVRIETVEATADHLDRVRSGANSS